MTAFDWTDVSFMVRKYVYRKKDKNETRNFEKNIDSS